MKVGNSYIEIFYLLEKDYEEYKEALGIEREDFNPGYYFWYCFPGCIPDSDLYGPFESVQEIIEEVENA